MATAKKKKVLPVAEGFCIGCQRSHPIEDFFKSSSPFHPNGYLPYCKDACELLVRYYLKRAGNIEAAIWLTCATLGIPFLSSAFENANNRYNTYKHTDTRKYFGIYMNFLNPYFIQSSKPKVDFFDTDVGLNQLSSLKQSKEIIELESQRFELDWGKQTVPDYQFLEYRYDVYTKDVDGLTPAQETLYRKLCLVELAMRRKEENGDDTKTEQAQMITLMDKLKITSFVEDKSKSIEDNFMEKRIAILEEEEPAYHYKDLDKYCDFMHIGVYWYNFITRPMKNLLMGSKEYTLKESEDDISPDVKEDADNGRTE